MTQDAAAMSAPSAGSGFDAEVRRLRTAGVIPMHKRYGRRKADCTPLEWAMHLEWRAAYYSDRKEEFGMYRNRWLAKKR